MRARVQGHLPHQPEGLHILADKLDTPPPHVGVSKLRAYAVYTDTLSRQIILIHTTCTDVENILNFHNSIVGLQSYLQCREGSFHSPAITLSDLIYLV